MAFRRLASIAWLLTALLRAADPAPADLPVRALMVNGLPPAALERFLEFVRTDLPREGVNTLIFQIDYNYQYASHPELVPPSAYTPAQVKALVAAGRAAHVRIIPLVNCLGHQSWAKANHALLTAYPQFDETPGQFPGNEGIYCRSYCPNHPDVHRVVCDVLGEIAAAFETDAVHVGMDEVFLLGAESCPRCRGRDPAELFAQEVRTLHDFLASRQIRLWLWGDRFLDGATTGLGRWEASYNQTARALDLVPKDIVVCDWHYENAAPTAAYFALKGFDVVTCSYNRPEVAVAQAEDMVRWRQENASNGALARRFLGVMATNWSSSATFADTYRTLQAGGTAEKSEPVRAFIAMFARLSALDRPAPRATGPTEWHVALTGDDRNSGAANAPFRTIQHAADLAQPGDTITVHAGVYRERVNPPRGGTADDARIVYRAAPGERVEITGSEPATGWVRVQGATWKLTRPNSFFGRFNPYADVLHGDWFQSRNRVHHTGAVYLNGAWLTEADSLAETLAAPGPEPRWFGQVDPENTTIWAQFAGVDPNAERVEINVRQTVFYPDQPGRNFITVRGFILRAAATPWAPPTAEQIGLIGPHWSKGWIIEDNTISHSICSGISLGKYGDAYDNTSADSAEGYVATIRRAQAFAIPWTREAVGHHLVRHNHVSHCEQAGIVGSLGCSFSRIVDNTIHDIHVRRRFDGAEMAGIKLHGAIDVEISHNEIFGTNRGIWLDWMAQGARVSGNLFHDNGPSEDLFLEVDHGPCLVDNNLFLSPTSLLLIAEDGAFAHNLITGRVTCLPDHTRETPYHPAHATTIAGLASVDGGGDRFFNNVFVGRAERLTDDSDWGRRIAKVTAFGLSGYNGNPYPPRTDGNVYLHGAQPFAGETGALVVPGNVTWTLNRTAERVQLHLTLPPGWNPGRTRRVTTDRLGRARVPGTAFENPDGSPLDVDADYLGHPRGAAPTAGPFETTAATELSLQVR